MQNCGALGEEWFSKLKFPKAVASQPCDERSLFECDGKERQTKRTPHTPEFGKYLLPAASNHPWIDRACLAVHENGTHCLILYQDKINNNLPLAVKSLNAAATMLHSKMNIPVLCVALVIGASNDTTCQKDFQFPYVLIRAEEVSKFFTPTFTSAIEFVRQRHSIQ